MTIILGIDPGLRITGYGLLQQEKGKLSLIDSGIIHTKQYDLPKCLKLIYIGINKIISQYKPECLAIEQVFVAKNASSALKLAQARGVAIVAAMNFELPVFEYAAQQVKQTVVGSGVAAKSQVQYMVRSILTLPFNPQTDVADALAIAITHYQFKQNTLRISSKNVYLTHGRLRG